MTRTKWNGRTIAAALDLVITRHGSTCWLCGHRAPRSSLSVDHVHPVSRFPHLEHDPGNWRPAHLHQAGTDQGCDITGCTCPGNKGRKDKTWTAPPSRTW